MARGLAPLVLLSFFVMLVAAAPTHGTAQRGEGKRCLGERATIVARDGATRGTDGADVIVARRAGGLIEAGGGKDLICARSRAFHEIYGEAGDDRIVTGPGQDYVYPGTGDDRARTGHGRDLVTDLERATGDDRLNGGPGRDRIRFSIQEAGEGGGGPVVLDLAAGLSSGHGHDALSGFEAVEGTFFGDVLVGDGADNVLDGVLGGDQIQGQAGDDLILGSTVRFGEGGGTADPRAGDDPLLDGGPGEDKIFGRRGADGLKGGSGDDLLDGGGQPSVESRGDRGNGGPGRDRCRGLESERGCE